MHIAGLVKLSHTCIHHRITSFSFAPQLEFFFVVPPFYMVISWFKRLTNNFRKMIENLHKKLSPYQFVEPSLIVLKRKSHTFTDTYSTKTQSCSKLCCLLQGREITIFVIMINNGSFQCWLFKNETCFF